MFRRPTAAKKVSILAICQWLVDHREPLYAPLFRVIEDWQDYFSTSAITAPNCATAINQWMIDRQCVINNARGLPLRFTNAQEGTAKKYYERLIAEEGVIETRDQSAHDIFNALCWIVFPFIKAAINALHERELSFAFEDADGSLPEKANRRSAERDFLTLLDEGGMIVVIDSASEIDYPRLFCDHQWRDVFIHHRARLIREIAPILIGHALYEKTLSPYPDMTARALFLHQPTDIVQALIKNDGAYGAALATVDQTIGQWLRQNQGRWHNGKLSTIPIYGFPHWADNDHPDFYRNTTIFRPKRSPINPPVLDPSIQPYGA